jgi:hypothetical protein
MPGAIQAAFPAQDPPSSPKPKDPASATSFLPGLLGLRLLHFLPQVGKLGGRFSGGLALVFGHIGGPPTQFYHWWATIGRMAAHLGEDL